jgi:hypothetical protein
MYTQYILRHYIKDIFILHSRIITVFLKYHHVNDGKVSVARALSHSGASPPAALRQGIARAAVDHVVAVEVLAPVTTRGPQTVPPSETLSAPLNHVVRTLIWSGGGPSNPESPRRCLPIFCRFFYHEISSCLAE